MHIWGEFVPDPDCAGEGVVSVDCAGEGVASVDCAGEGVASVDCAGEGVASVDCAGEEGVASVVSAAAEALVLEAGWLLPPPAGCSLRSGHLAHAWPVVTLYSMVRPMVKRLCCRDDHFSCWSMSPTLEVFRCLFSTKRAALLWTFLRLEMCLSLWGSHTAVTCVLRDGSDQCLVGTPLDLG